MAVFSTGERSSSGFSTEGEFEQVFRAYFKGLHSYACTLLRDPVVAEEIVQTIFVRLWEKRMDLEIREKLSSYLYRAVHNESMNYWKHQKRRSTYQSFAMRQPTQTRDADAAGKLSLRELEARLQKALNELPEQCRTIFQLSRFEELKYKEIADKLDISVKTVENQMGKALKLMRFKMLDWLPFLFLLFSHLLKLAH